MSEDDPKTTDPTKDDPPKENPDVGGDDQTDEPKPKAKRRAAPKKGAEVQVWFHANGMRVLSTTAKVTKSRKDGDRVLVDVVLPGGGTEFADLPERSGEECPSWAYVD